jgi:DNA-binding response OmpR family regulator
MRVLIADDDVDLATMLGFTVRTLWVGSEVAIAHDGREALRRFAAESPDLVVLDVMMPAPDGFEVCRRIRATSSVPILMLTARDTVLDEVRALDLGADDYLPKPFDHLRLSARLRSLARRVGRAAAGETIEDETDASGGLLIDLAAREVRIGGEPVDLTPTEYLLLEALARQPGAILPHRALLERVWGGEYAHDTHYLKVFINRLRRKLGDDTARPRYIQTCRGLGYRLLANQESRVVARP